MNTLRTFMQNKGEFFKRLLCFVMICAFLPGTVFFPLQARAWGEFTIKDEKELGDKFNVLIRSRLPLVQDPEILNYVTGIVKNIENTMPKQPFPFTVSVLRHNAVNAFATPGGYIFVHTGLLLAMDNESEVASVIAHEMAHVTQRHIARRIENSQYVGLLSLIGLLAGAFLGGDAGAAAVTGSMAAGQASMLHYSRNDEREADQVGMNYLTKAGYPPQGMVGAFEVLSRRQWLMGSTVPAYLSTHPGLTERVHDMGIRVSRLPVDQQKKQDDNSKFHRVQAVVRARYSDPSTAARTFAQQVNGPNKCMALMGLGIIASRQNKVKDGMNYFQQALACAPKDPVVAREAGIFHYSKGNRDLGATLLQRAVSMNPNDVIALFYQAKSLGDLGKTSEAIAMTQRVLQKVPEDADVHESLARLYGTGKQMFFAYLHLAYSYLYQQNPKKLNQFLERAKPLAKTEAEKKALARFEDKYKERKQFWK